MASDRNFPLFVHAPRPNIVQGDRPTPPPPPRDGHPPFTAWREPGLLPTPSLQTVRDLEAEGILPPFRQRGVPKRRPTGYVYQPHSFEGIYRVMGAGGWRADIGWCHEAIAMFCAEPSDETWADAQNVADGLLSAPWYLADPDTGKPPLWLYEPWSNRTYYRGRGEGHIPGPKADHLLAIDISHTPQACYVAWRLTDAPSYAVATVYQGFWHHGSNWHGNRQNWWASAYNARMLWWGTRDLVMAIEAAEALGWREHVDMLLDAERRTIDTIMERVRQEPYSWLGIVDFDYSGEHFFSPWQADMGCIVLAWVVGRGREQWRPVLDHIARGARLRDDLDPIMGYGYRIFLGPKGDIVSDVDEMVARNADYVAQVKGEKPNRKGELKRAWWVDKFDVWIQQALMGRQMMHHQGYDFGDAIAWLRAFDDRTVGRGRGWHLRFQQYMIDYE